MIEKDGIIYGLEAELDRSTFPVGIWYEQFNAHWLRRDGITDHGRPRT